jgi:twinkle protein
MSLTSIEKTAIQLDEFRKTRLKETPVDFDAYMKARDQDVALIKPADDFREALYDEFYGETAAQGLYLPWNKVADKWRIRPGELTIWSGYNGHRKSMVTGFVLLDLLNQGQKGCVLSFEMMPTKTLRRMACQAVGVGKPTKEYIDKFLDFLAGKMWLYDQQGTVTPDRVYAVITYCAEQLGINQFLVDSMTKVIPGEDDYNLQKQFAGRLQDTARDLTKAGHPTHIHLITHAKKTGDESKRPGKQENRGSGTIVDQTDNFAAVFRLPKKEAKQGEPADAGPDHCIYLDKQRNAADGWEGTVALWFDEMSLQFREGKFDKVRRYV